MLKEHKLLELIAADPAYGRRGLPRTLFALALLASVLIVLTAFAYDDIARGWDHGNGFWSSVTRLGQAEYVLVPSGVLALLLAWRRRAIERHFGRDVTASLTIVVFLFAAVAATGLVADLFKFGLGWPRPRYEALSGPRPWSFDAHFASFPSGHSTTAGATAAAVVLLFRRWRWIVWPLALLIGLSRIMLQQHHLSDVAAGLLLGGWGTVALAILFARHNKAFSIGEGGWPRARECDIDAVLRDIGLAWRSLRPQPTIARAAASAPVRNLLNVDMPMIVTSEPGFVSVVIPAKDEADNLAVIIPEIMTAMAGRTYEIIAVDDGSTDGTAALLARYKREGHPVRHIRHELPCGQSAAVRSGMLMARGEIVATIDGDGQNDPAYIPVLVDALIKAGPAFGIAAGQRLKRTDGTLKKYASKFANGLRGAILKDKTRDTGCGLKAVRRELFLKLPFFHGWHRYLPALVLREGFDVTHVDVIDRSRIHGQSNYGIFDRALQGVLDLYGVWWLRRRIKRLPAMTEIE